MFLRTALLAVCLMGTAGMVHGSKAKTGSPGSTGMKCFVPGHCLDSMMLKANGTASASDCLEQCHNTDGCEWFTWYSNSKTCVSLSTCLNLTRNGCTDCISGEEECPEPICNSKGRCFGALEGVEPIGSVDKCKKKCLDGDHCNWFSFDRINKWCQLTADCPSLDKTQGNWTSSEKGCEFDKIGVCKSDETYDIATGTCAKAKAKAETKVNVACKSDEAYDIATGTCAKANGDCSAIKGQVWDPSARKCVCTKPNVYIYSGKCNRCKKGLVWRNSPWGMQCVKIVSG